VRMSVACECECGVVRVSVVCVKGEFLIQATSVREI
jgi:hypothetical protein